MGILLRLTGALLRGAYIGGLLRRQARGLDC
jgi:hypothetical protein